MASNLCGEFSSLNTKFKVWHPCHHDYAFVIFSGLLQYQFPNYSSSHVTPQYALNSKKEKYLVVNTKIGKFCTKLECIHLNCYILCNAFQRLQPWLATSKKNLKVWDNFWRTPKSRVEPTWGSNYVELRKVGLGRALPTSSTIEG